MTRLLVSVRDAAEAALALAAGADMLDVKEPSHGPLGVASPETIQMVLQVANGRVPVSAAFGELWEHELLPADPPAGLSYAKLGLSGCQGLQDWQDRWTAVVIRWSKSVAPVAVAYADWRDVAAPSPAEILAHGRSIGCQAFLVDTFNKLGGDLFQLAAPAELQHWIELARANGMLVVLGGSLTLQTIPQALMLKPDYVAVRGAACHHRREGRLDPQRVRALADLVNRRAVVAGMFQA